MSNQRHRFLENSINHVSFHNRLTEEEMMWRRRDQEIQGDQRPVERNRSRSFLRRRSPPPKTNDQPVDAEFGPPLPSNLGINADRWDHALFQQRHPDEYQRKINESKRSPRRSSTTSDEDKKRKKKKKKKHHRRKSTDEKEKKKSKRERRHRSRS